MTDWTPDPSRAYLMRRLLMGKVKIGVMGYRCTRCGHEWKPRTEAEPRVCPKCKSPYWNVERRIKRVSKAGWLG